MTKTCISDFINAIHEGKIKDTDMDNLPIFNLQFPKNISGVDSSILNPANYSAVIRKGQNAVSNNAKRSTARASVVFETIIYESE